MNWKAVFAVFALLCSSAFADCRETRGGHMQELKSAVAWQARAGCGEGTLVWFSQASHVDDLLIVADLEKGQTLSLLSPLGVECSHKSDKRSLVIAVGEWGVRSAPGGRSHVYRAWRFDGESRKAVEVPIQDVACVQR